MPPAPAPHPVHGPMHPGRCVSARRHEGSDPGCPCWGRGGCRAGQGQGKLRGVCAHLWAMSSTLTRPHTPTTKLSTSHSLTPRAMRKCPSSPHALPHELAAVCNGGR